jgi:hypothetical protein
MTTNDNQLTIEWPSMTSAHLFHTKILIPKKIVKKFTTH